MSHDTTDQKILLPLDAKLHGPLGTMFLEFVASRAVGQKRIFGHLANTLDAIFGGFFPERGPAGSVLLVGPSGVGKTYATKLLAEFLFGDPTGFLQIDGQSLSERFDVKSLTGAPPGYIGYDDPPLITQAKLDAPAYKYEVRCALFNADESVRKEYAAIERERRYILRRNLRTKKELGEAQKRLDVLSEQMEAIGIPSYDPVKYHYLSVFHIDEIERAHPIAFPNIMFRVLDEGELALSAEHDGSDKVSFRRTIIIATSNLGSDEITKMMKVWTGRAVNMGFRNEEYTAEKIDKKIYEICRDEVNNFFTTPFINRFGEVIVARPHFRDDMFKIFDMEMEKLQARLFNERDLNFPVVLRLDESVRTSFVDEAMKYPEKGIRLLQQKINKRLLHELPKLRATGQLREGDILRISLNPVSKKPLYFKEEHSGASKKIIIVE